MTVQTLYADVPALTTTDTVAHALVQLAESGVAHLPVVGPQGVLVALAGEEELREHPDPQDVLVMLSGGMPISVSPETHVFDAAHVLQQHGLSVLPVVGDENRYVGTVVRRDVFEQLAHMLATEEPGAIVVLDLDRHDYSLAQIAHLVEQNGVRILSASTEDDPGAGRVRVTLKLSVTDTARVRHIMSHYDYRIVATFDESEDDIRERAQAFLRYLEV